MPVEQVCLACGTSFLVKPYRVREGISKYCSRACKHEAQRGPACHFWKRGHFMQNGYRQLTLPDGRYVAEHRLIMEQQLGRPLRSDEHVHHRDGDRLNNEPANLAILTNVEHARLHQVLAKGQWSKHYAACLDCERTDRPHHGYGLCQTCRMRRRRARDARPARWSTLFDACTRCLSTNRKHKGHGLCTACYAWERHH